MTADADLGARFQAARPHLSAVAYRMLGSVVDAEDAVQEAWLRLAGVDAGQVDNLDAWLTTAVARICLNTLRSRRARPPEELVAQLPDPIVDAVGDVDPEHQAMLADAVGMALFVILDTLAPAERLAFVLHDVFAVPFDQIAPVVERTPEATRKLASRAASAFSRPRRARTPTWWHSTPSSTLSSPPDVPATWIGWSPFWTPTCRCAATSAQPDNVRCEGHRRWPGWPRATPPRNAKFARPSSTGPRVR